SSDLVGVAVTQFEPISLVPTTGTNETKIKPALGIFGVSQRVIGIEICAEDLTAPYRLQKLCNIQSIFQIYGKVIIGIYCYLAFFPGKTAKVILQPFEQDGVLRRSQPRDLPLQPP